jgi:hypothetical protein
MTRNRESDMDRTGQCLCGAVHFTIRDLDPEYGVCHCKMCQRWAGSMLAGLTVPEGTVEFTGAEHIGRYQSSEWAERAFCSTCGSGLYYRVTMAGPYAGTYHMPVGLLDDTSDLTLSREIYVDAKPDSFALAGERERLDTKATLELFGITEDGV